MTRELIAIPSAAKTAALFPAAELVPAARLRPIIPSV